MEDVNQKPDEADAEARRKRLEFARRQAKLTSGLTSAERRMAFAQPRGPSHPAKPETVR